MLTSVDSKNFLNKLTHSGHCSGCLTAGLEWSQYGRRPLPYSMDKNVGTTFCFHPCPALFGTVPFLPRTAAGPAESDLLACLLRCWCEQSSKWMRRGSCINSAQESWGKVSVSWCRGANQTNWHTTARTPMLFTVEAWEKAVPESCKGVKATGEQPCLKVSYQRATRMLLMSVRLRCAISISIETDDWICSAFLRHECPKNEQPKCIVTWLILPVVICLSQRLSHACLSMNVSILWNCEWLIKSVIVYLMVTLLG